MRSSPRLPPIALLPVALQLACADASPGEQVDAARGDEASERAVPSVPAPPAPAHPLDSSGPDTGHGHLELIALTKLDLHADAPADAELDDAIFGDGLTILSDELNVRVELAGEQTPATLAEAKAEAELLAPTKPAEKTLSDGWTLTFESASPFGQAYWVQVRRDVDGRSVWCTSTSSSEARQTAALALCTSLRG